MLKSFDFFRKIQTDQQLTSATGGCFTILSLIVAGILILMSLQDFYQEKYYTFLAVKNDDAEYLPMRIDITFYKTPCEVLTIQFHDELQYVQSNLQDKLTLYDVPKGLKAGEVFRAAQNRQAQREKLIQHIRQGYQCRIVGIINLPKTPGTVSFTTNTPNSLIFQIDQDLQSQIRMNYRLDALSFGLGNNTFDFPIAHKSKNIENYIKYLEGDINNRTVVQNFQNNGEANDFLNHVKIIPVVIESDGKQSQPSSQNYRYSLRSGFSYVQENFPRLMFMTEIQPINIVYKKHEPQLYELVRQLLAIVGGTVATIGIFNTFSHFLFNIK